MVGLVNAIFSYICKFHALLDWMHTCFLLIFFVSWWKDILNHFTSSWTCETVGKIEENMPPSLVELIITTTMPCWVQERDRREVKTKMTSQSQDCYSWIHTHVYHVVIRWLERCFFFQSCDTMEIFMSLCLLNWILSGVKCSSTRFKIFLKVLSVKGEQKRMLESYQQLFPGSVLFWSLFRYNFIFLALHQMFLVSWDIQTCRWRKSVPSFRWSFVEKIY